MNTLLESISVTELCEYAANVDIPISRESIRAVGKIALQQYDVNAIVDRLLQFLEMEKDYVTAEALVSNKTVHIPVLTVKPVNATAFWFLQNHISCMQGNGKL